MEVGEGDGLAWKLAASGFRDASRLAASGVPMSLDLLMTNGENVAREVRRLAVHLEGLARLLEAGEEEALEKLLEAAQERREGLFG
jgi:prephenate dehydrogenase